MANIAIIPARGGSKRIPRKNIKLFLGKPIIAYSIEMALKSKLFDEVMVSTDDEEIAEVALKFGANVPFFRSKAHSNDFASTADVLKEVLNDYNIKLKKTFEFACCIYPTAPLITFDALSEGYLKLKTENFDSIFPVVPFGYPIQRALKIENEIVSFANPDFAQSRSQDLEKRYHDAGQWYWLNCEIFLKTNTIVTANSSALVLHDMAAQDIDNETDWKLAELKYELLQGSK